MDFLTDWLTNWLKELLIGGIMGNLEGLFDTVNTQVGEIAAQVGTTSAASDVYKRQGRDYPGGVARRGFLPDPTAFRNGDPADCRNGADLCCHL